MELAKLANTNYFVFSSLSPTSEALFSRYFHLSSNEKHQMAPLFFLNSLHMYLMGDSTIVTAGNMTAVFFWVENLSKFMNLFVVN